MVEGSVGYRSVEYASSLEEFGSPDYIFAKGWILRRQIVGTSYHDAMGLYPIMCCEDWSKLPGDLNHMSDLGLVSFVAVVDPFSNQSADGLVSLGFDFARHYKDHVIVNPKTPSISKHHRYYARQALKNVDIVEREPRDAKCLDDWCTLYEELVSRHGITGIQAFSKESFRWQLAAPGMVVFDARSKGEIVGMHLWYEHDNVAYSHLAASTERGYDLMAAYALHIVAIDYFNGRVERLDLGGPPGNSDNGLAWFKKGWSVDTLPSYLCGSVLRPSIYKELTDESTTTVRAKNYFPAYRASEHE